MLIKTDISCFNYRPPSHEVFTTTAQWLGQVQTLFSPLTEAGRHLIQRDPDGAVLWRVIRVEGQELLAQQTQTLLLPAWLFVGVFLFLGSFKLDRQKNA